MFGQNENIRDDVLCPLFHDHVNMKFVNFNMVSTRTRADWDKSVVGFIAMNE